MTIQGASFVSHHLLDGDAITLRSWCKDTGRQELSLKPRHTQHRKGSENCTHSDNSLVKKKVFNSTCRSAKRHFDRVKKQRIPV